MPRHKALRPLRLTLTAASLLAAAVTAPVHALAQEAPAPARTKSPLGKAGEQQQPVLLTADELIHDQDLGIVTARGHVEISQDDRILLADSVSYNLKRDVIAASGNVSLTEATGEVMFSDYFELTGDLKNGTAQNIRMLLADNSRMAALSGSRTGDATQLNKAVYSPCEPCRDNPDAAPLWQIKAMRVIHDQQTKDVEYSDAWLEMYGVPVIYTPYLSHPDPTVKRRSGFLPPSFGHGNNLGVAIETPYYWTLSPQEDITFSPLITSGEGPVLAGEHRRRFQDGEMRTQASLTQDSEDRTRGHIRAKGQFDLDETWRAGYQVERSSDDTYLRRYGFGEPKPWLVTRPYLEGFTGRSYALAEAFDFQGLRETDDPGLSPVVLPFLQYNYVGNPGRYGGYWSFDSSALAITRGEGTDTRRLATQTTWQLPYTSPMGDIYTVSASLRADGYNVSDRTADSGAESTGRLQPQLAVEWRYPFMRPGESSYQVIQPIVMAAVAPYGGNPDRIPNEDSADFEFNETNLFSPNRFTGSDRVEGGPRAAYGMQWGLYGNKGGYTEVLFGQSIRAHTDNDFPENSGLEDQLSDYVGRVIVSPGQDVDVVYRFRLAEGTFAARRSDLAAMVGPKALRLSADYVFLDKTSSDEFNSRQELYLQLSSAFSRYWSASVFSRNDLSEDGGPIANGGTLSYEDECFIFGTTYQFNGTNDRDYKSGHSIMFRLVFKTLGEVPIRAY